MAVKSHFINQRKPMLRGTRQLNRTFWFLDLLQVHILSEIRRLINTKNRQDWQYCQDQQQTQIHNICDQKRYIYDNMQDLVDISEKGLGVTLQSTKDFTC